LSSDGHISEGTTRELQLTGRQEDFVRDRRMGNLIGCEKEIM